MAVSLNFSNLSTVEPEQLPMPATSRASSTVGTLITQSLLRLINPQLWLPLEIKQPTSDGVNSITMYQAHGLDVALVFPRRANQHHRARLEKAPNLGDGKLVLLLDLHRRLT
jgi:hypothetical protein